MALSDLPTPGNFRGKHSELITNCEQIAFLGGERPEKDVLNHSFAELMSHCRRTINASFNSEVLRQYLNKYFCTVIGLILIARPLRHRAPEMGELRNDQIAQYFTSTWRNMEAMATAIQDGFKSLKLVALRSFHRFLYFCRSERALKLHVAAVGPL